MRDTPLFTSTSPPDVPPPEKEVEETARARTCEKKKITVRVEEKGKQQRGIDTIE